MYVVSNRDRNFATDMFYIEVSCNRWKLALAHDCNMVYLSLHVYNAQFFKMINGE